MLLFIYLIVMNDVQNKAFMRLYFYGRNMSNALKVIDLSPYNSNKEKVNRKYLFYLFALKDSQNF